MKKKAKLSNVKLVSEELEPRLLLSADGLAVITESSVATVHELVLGENETDKFIVQNHTEQSSVIVQAKHHGRELVIIDSRAPNFQQLHNDIIHAQQQGRNIQVVILDVQRDGIEQISEALTTYNDLDAVHIVSHGESGKLQLGATQLDKQNLKHRAEEIKQWQSAFVDAGDLLLYGCNLAGTTDGQSLVNELAKQTQTDVAASDDLTGNSILGGDWDLEYQTGEIEASLAFSEDVQENWQGTLKTTSPAGAEVQPQQVLTQEQQVQLEREAELAVRLEDAQAAAKLDQERQQAVIAEQQRQEIVFIDESVDDYQVFIDDLQANSEGSTSFEVVLLDGDSNGIEQINEFLSSYNDIDAVHILSHGDDGAVKLGNTWLSADNIDDYSESFSAWNDSLDVNADLLIYGCNLAESQNGEQFVGELAKLTGADVAASDDLTGSVLLGGDWDLEYEAGDIETSIAISAHAQQSWEGLLGTPTFWDYHHTIGFTTATADNNYPVEITLTEGVNGFSHANAQVNGEDIRFYDTAGNELSYWIESWNNAGTSTVWVNVDTAGTTSIDLYYGNSGVASASNPDATFLLFDDFEDDTVGTLPAGWTLAQGAPTGTAPSIKDDAGNQVLSDGANTGGPVVDTGNWSDVVVSQDFRSINNGDPINHAGLIARYEDVNNMVYGGIINKDTAQIWYREAGTFTKIGGDWSITGLAVDDGNWHNQELRVFDDTVELYIDDTFIGSASLAATGSAAGTSGQTGFWSQYSNYEAYRDNHIVRSYDAGTGDIATSTANEGYTIAENSANGTIVGNVLATDPDVADVLSYSITAGNTGSAFDIDSNGLITVFNSAALDFETTPTFNLTVEVSDGNGGIDSDTTTITLNNINDAPTYSSMALAPTWTENGGAVSLFSGTSIDAIEAGDLINVLTIDVTGVADGSDEILVIDGHTIALTDLNSVTTAGNGYDVSVSTPGSTAYVTITRVGGFSATAAEALVDGLAYDNTSEAPQGPGRIVTLGLIQDDGGTANGGQNTTAYNLDSMVTIVATNDAPVNSVPTAQTTNEDTPLVFNTTNSNLISISDVDAGAGLLEVTLSVNDGVLGLSGTTGLTFVAGSDGSAAMTFSGTLSDINTALDGLSFTPDSNFNGSASLQITTYDDTSLIASYSFDDTGNLGADNSTGTVYDGTATGATSINDATRGDVLSLDGTTHVEIPGFFGNPVDATLAAWVNVTAYDSNGTDIISLGDNLILRYEDWNNSLNGAYYDGTGWSQVNFLTGINLAGDGWHHVAYSVDDTNNTHAIYFDGVEVASSTMTGSVVYTNGTNSYIGAHGELSPQWDLIGLVDDARIYDRALSATEIATLANAPVQSSDTDTVAITVNAVNDAPVITSDGGTATAAINVPENTTAVTTVTATDVDLDTVTYSISGGADAALFSIDANSGVLTFNSAPNFEAPADADTDNVYQVTVQAIDGKGGTDTQAISVTVTNVLELVVTNTNATGTGSLHDAIMNANANTGVTDTITFNIAGAGPHTINLTGALPTITDTIIIDGATEPDYAGTPIIELDGSSAGAGVSGITLGAGSDGSTIRGLVINQFANSGIMVDNSDNNVITGNYIGTDASGNTQAGNDVQATGITITGSSGNVIGGTGAGEANVLSGNRLRGVIIVGSTSMNNVVLGNYIGTNADGSAALTNVGSGQQIGIYLYDAPSNTIGGTTVGAGNIISGNISYGIYTWGPNTTGNEIQGNTIGLDASRTIVIGNGNAGSGGILLSNAPGNIIGGTTAGAANVISGHLGAGVMISGSSGTGNSILGNQIHSNSGLGIDLDASGVTSNDANDVDTGSNNLQNFPVLTTAITNSVDEVLVNGTLNSTANSYFRIEFFANSSGDATGFGEGQTYIGFANVVTDGSGNATIDTTLNTSVPVGAIISATATRSDATYTVFTDTSEFSANISTVANSAPVASNDSYAVNEDNTLTVDWWDSDWTRRQELSFDNLAQSETLTDVPVLVVLNSSNINYSQTRDDGSDLRFFAADGTPLAYEIEQWNEGGDSSVWIKVPQITGNSNSDSIMMYYGNASAATGEDAAGVWDSNFVGVWHLSEDQAGTGGAGVYTDSTSYGNDGSDQVAATGQEGQVTDGQQFGANDWIDIDHDTSLDLKDSMTISFWIKPTENSGTFERVIEKGLWGYGSSYYFGGGNGTNDLTFYLNNQAVFDTSDNVLTVGAWQHVAVSYTSNGDGTGSARLYIDGVEVDIDGVPVVGAVPPIGTYSGGAVPGNTGRLAIGHENSLYDFNKFIDEVQISNTARSADWIAAQYKATNNALANEFVLFGGEQLAPATDGVLTNDTDFEGDAITVNTTPITDVSNGSLTLKADGTFNYTPDADFNGTDSFTYEISDSNGNTSQATVSITINAVNDAPVATADPGVYSSELQDLNPLSYWRMGDAGGTAIDLGSTANNGSYNGGSTGQTGGLFGDADTSVHFDGSEYVEIAHSSDYLLDNGTLQLWFNPDAPANGDLQHLFSKDASGFVNGGHISMYLNTSGQLEVRLQSNTTDYIVRSAAAVTAGDWHHAAFSFGSNGMELYLDGQLVDSDVYTGGLGTTSGDTGNVEGIAIGAGTQNSTSPTINPVNQLFTGAIDEVALFDNQLNAQNIQRIYDAGANQFQVSENGTLNLPTESGVLANDTDIDGDTLNVSEVNGAAVNVGSQITLASGALLTVNADGSMDYDPNGQFEYLKVGDSATDTFNYTISDGNGESDTASVTITINGVNNLPIAVGETYNAIEGVPYTTQLGLDELLLNDSDPEGDTLTVNTMPVSGPTNGSLVLNADGTFTYTPNNDFNGTDSFVYEINDGMGGTAQATATINVAPREVRILFSTQSDVNNSKVPGISSWDAGELLGIGDPNLSFEPAGSDGSVLPYMDLEQFAASNNMTINGLHFVSNDITVGSTSSVTLQRSDLLFVSDNNETMTSNNTLAINAGDVIVFRPTAVDDYSSGTFIHLLDQPGTAMTTGITLIEKDVTIGDVTLSAGGFLFTQESVDEESSIYHFSADDVGAGTTTGTVSTLISSVDMDVNWNNFVGVMVINEDLYLNGTMVPAGSIVTTLAGGDSFVGDNGIEVNEDEIIYLTVTTTTMGGSGTTQADATILFDGGDIGLNNNSKKMRNLTIIEEVTLPNVDPDITLAATALTYSENDPPTVIDATATLVDPDSANFDTGVLRVELTVGGSMNDRLTINHEGTGGGQVGVSSNTVSYGGVDIGTFSGGASGSEPLLVVFDSDATVAAVEAVMQNITFENVSPNPSTAQRTATFTVTDGDGGSSTAVARNINVIIVNDAPVLSGANDLATINEDAFNNGGTLVSDLVSGHITDTDTGALHGIAVVGVDNTNGSWEYTTDNGANWTAFGTASTNAATLLASDADTRVRFVPDPGWNGTVNNGITFHAWDQTVGANGDTVDLTLSDNLRDNFSAVSYANNDGSGVWTSTWREVNDDSAVASGNIQVTGGKLRLDNQDDGSLESIARAADLSSAATATLTFDYDGYGSGSLDTIAFEVSNDGGSSWSLLENVDIIGNDSGSKSYALEDYTALTDDMLIRMRIVQGFNEASEHVNIDNVDIAYAGPGIGGSDAASVATASSSISVTSVNNAPTMTMWYSEDWSSRKQLTIDAAQVAGDVTDFPLLISINTDPELAAQALANGDDIVFTAGDGGTLLAYEIEYFDETTGELRAWVKTDLSASVDTDIYIYFGNAGATNQEDPSGVWSSNYVGVYHLDESPDGTPGEIIDVSGNNNHGATEGAMDAADLVNTAIGEGLAFDGANDMIRIPDSASLDGLNDAATFSLWINWVNAADGDHQIIMASDNRYSGGDGYEWASQGDGDHFFYPDATSPDGNYNLGLNPFTNDNWHHLAATMDYATKEVKIYVDGNEMSFSYEGVPARWTDLSASGDLLWGGNPDRATRFFQGMMDEIRMADVVRSQEWIQTEANNQSSPGTFLSIGSVEAVVTHDTLTDINEDDLNSPGDTVSSIISSSGSDRIMDDDVGALEGIAVIGVDDSNGQWQYDANADGTWVAFGAVSDSSAVLLDTDALIRFVPSADYNGPAGDMTFHAWDQTSGNNGNTGIDVSTTGGSTAFSNETFDATLNVNPVNDAPVLDNTGDMFLSNILSNTTDPQGDLVSEIINSVGGDRITDVDTGAVEGLAIVAVDDSNGVWQYSTNGGLAWTAFGAVNNSSAVVLTDTANDRIRFVPDTDYIGDATITFRAWDASDANVSGTTGVDTGAGGGSSAFSTAIETADIIVEGVEIKLILSTSNDVGHKYGESNSNVKALPSWSEGEIISMRDPRVAFGENNTDGSFTSMVNFDTFATDTDVDITGLHYVASDITVTGAGINGGTIDLLAGDVIFVTEVSETLSNAASGAPAGWANNIVTSGGGVYVFRAENVDDYSSGYFNQIMADPGSQTQAISLVEVDTLIGDTVVSAGDFLFSDTANTNAINWYDTSLNVSNVLVNGSDIGINDNITGIDLIEIGATLGGMPLSTGTILITLDTDDASVGDNLTATSMNDIVALDISATTYGSATASANSTIFFDGDGNARFDTANENLDAFSLIITGTGANVAPTLGNTGPAVSYTEGTSPVIIDSTILVVDGDSADFASGLISVDITAGGSTGDRLSIFNQGTGAGQIGLSGNDITYGGTIIGSFSGGLNSADPLVINLNANADVASTQALMRNITYTNTASNPVTAARTIEFILTDGDGGVSNIISQSATVIAIDDDPVAVDDPSGLAFDGTDDYISIADSASLTMTNTLTMEAWIKADPSTNVNRMIINKEGEYEVALFADGSINWAFANTDPGWTWYDTGYVVSDGEWAHIAVTYDNGTVSTYVNGEVVDVYNGLGVIGDAHATYDELRIGGRTNNPADKYFNGEINEVRIWDTVRTQGEIIAAMDQALVGNEAGLVGYWDFSEGIGSSVIDLTGNGNDGTLIDGGSGTAGPQWTAYTTDQDTAINIAAIDGILSNDIDGNNDPLTVTQVNGSVANVGSLITLASGANLTVGSLGDFSYDPNGSFDYLGLGQTVKDTFTYQVDDGNGGTDTATVTITITGVNDVPLATNLNAAESYTEDTALNLTDIVVSDVDSANVTVTLTLSDVAAGSLNTATSGAVTSTFVGGVWTASGAIADVNTLLAGVTFNPSLNYNSNFSIATSVDDGVAAAITGSKSMTATAVNDVPTATNLSAAETYTEDTALDLTDIVVSDIDSANVTVTLTLSDVAAGTLSTATSNLVTSTFVGGVWTASGAIADVNSLLAGVTFTPASNYNSNFSIATSVDDGVATAITGTKVMTGSAVNDAPTIESTIPDQILSEDFASYTIDLNAAFADVETADSAFVYGVSGNTNINVSIASGIATITPTANWNGSETLTFSATDAGGLSASQDVDFTVNPVNDAPMATNLSAPETYTEDTALNLTDIVVSDIDSANVTVTLTLSDVAAGSLNTATSGVVTSTFVGGVWTASGAIADVNSLLAGVTFTPTLSYNSNFSIATSVDDGMAAAITGTKVMTGSAVNDAPTIESTIPDQILSEDYASYTIDLNGAFADVETADSALIYNVSGNTNINVNISSGIATITPTANWNGSETLTFSATDAGGLSVSQDVDFTVSPVNDTPTIESTIPDQVLAEDFASYTIDLNAAFDDVETADSALVHGVSGNTNINVSIASGIATITPTANWNGSETLTFSATDTGGLSVSQDVGFTVNPVNDTPTIESTIPDQVLAEDFASYTIDLTAAFADVETADNALVYNVSGNTNINVSISSGIATITSTANWNGSETLTFSATDAGGLSASQDVDFTVNPVNDAPTVANAIADVTVAEDAAPTIIDLSSVFSDVDIATNTDSLTYSAVSSDGTLVTASVSGNTLTLTYAAGQNGAATITVTATDTNGPLAVADPFTVTVTPVNDAPTATNLSAAETYTEDTALNLTDIVVSDVDSANVTVTLTLSDVAAGSLSTATSGAVTSTFVGGVWTASGAIADVNTLLAGVTFNPALNYNSNFSIATSVDDGVAAAITGSKSMTATAVNDAPTATNLSAAETYTEDTALNLTDIVVSDVDSANVTVALTLSDVAAGSLSTATSGAVTSTFVGGVWTASGAIADVNTLLAGVTFNPTLSYNSNFNILTSVDDGVAAAITGSKSMTATATNDAPVIIGTGGVLAYTEGAGAQVIENSLIISDVDDTNIESAIVYISSGFIDSEDILSFTNTANITGNFNVGTGVLTLTGTDTLVNYESALESITYTNTNSDNPNTGNRIITWMVNDGSANSAAVTSTITVTEVNDAPVAADDTIILAEGGSVIIDLAANDSDVDDGLNLNSIVIIGAPSNGSFINNADGTVTYNHDGSDTSTDTFTYTISDISGAISNTATVNIVITPVNDQPTTSGIADVTVNEDSANRVIDLNASFDDTDNLDSELTYSIVGNTSIGLFSLAGIDNTTGQLTLGYAADMNGAAQISIRATDPSGASVDTMFTVNITPVNDAPVLIANDGVTTEETGRAVISNSELNVDDVDNVDSGIVYTVTAVPANGALLLNGSPLTVNSSFTEADIINDNLSYQSDGTATSDQFVFTVADGAGGVISDNIFEIAVVLSPPEPEEPPTIIDPATQPDPVITPESDDTEQTVVATESVLNRDLDGFSTGGSGRTIQQPTLSLDPIKRIQLDQADPGVFNYSDQKLEANDRAQINFSTASTIADVQVRSIEALWSAIDQMKHDMDDNVVKSMTNIEFRAAAVSSSGVALTAGVVAWVLRSGALMTSLISTIPLWKGYDPLPILAYKDDDEEEIAEDKIPTSLEELKKIKAMKEKMNKNTNIDDFFGGSEVEG